jgi:hypothetical protein
VGRVPWEIEVTVRNLTYAVTLRDQSGLPINIAASEIRMKIMELLFQQIDVQAIELVASQTKE